MAQTNNATASRSQAGRSSNGQRTSTGGRRPRAPATSTDQSALEAELARVTGTCTASLRVGVLANIFDASRTRS